MDTRLSKAKRLVRATQCSHLLVSDVTDVRYMCGFEATNAYLLISSLESLLFTDFRYRGAAERFCKTNPSWRFVEMGENSFSSFARFLTPGDRVGIQSDVLTVRQYDLLRHHCRGVRFAKLGGKTSEIMSVKYPVEISAVRRAARIGDKAFGLFTQHLKEGLSEKDAARLLESQCNRFGSEGPSFPTIVLFGPRTALPHGHPTGRRLREGDLILCDFGCTFNGFCSDMTRTLVFGKANERQRTLYRVVLDAQAAARRAVRVGATVAHVDKCARQIIDKAGFGKFFGHATGHGVGRRVHEKPRLGQYDRTILQKNMIVTIEPGVYLPRWGGIRIEDMVVVTAGGGRLLTHSPRNHLEMETGG